MKKSADNLSVPQQQEEINHSLRSPNLSRQSSYNDISINISKFVPESASQPKPVAENNNTKTSKLGISKKFSFINTLSEVTGVKSMLKLTSDVIKVFRNS